jgi:hypothetical protein
MRQAVRCAGRSFPIAIDRLVCQPDFPPPSETDIFNPSRPAGGN